MCVTSLLPTLSLTQIPVHEQGDAGKSFIKRRVAHSAVKKSFHLSQWSDERHELMKGFLWRMWLRAWAAGSGGGGAGVRFLGRGEDLFWGRGEERLR